MDRMACSKTRKRLWFSLTLSTAVLTVAPGHSVAVLLRAGHAKVELLSEHTGILRGGMTTLGVRFTIDDGWHIYWRNPGESGGAPTVAWTAPSELSIGDLAWPIPTRFAAPGDTTYGYEHAVLLLAPIRVVDSDATSAALDVRARVDYQICKDVCVKETANVTKTLPIGQTGASADADLFTLARATLPMPMPPEWTASASIGPEELLLDVNTGRTETAAVFFPYHGQLIDDSSAQRIDTRLTGLSLHLKKSRGFSTTGPSLDGLLLRPGDRAVEISASVR
jgi:thiol:disulfide interchange protein DsbD